jgi:hypothetical protein
MDPTEDRLFFSLRPALFSQRMPTVLRIGGYRFHFYSDERGEPPHIHVQSASGECKFWLEPVALADNKGIAGHEIRRIERLVFEYEPLLREKFREYHGR